MADPGDRTGAEDALQHGRVDGNPESDPTVPSQLPLTNSQYLMWIGQNLYSDAPLYDMVHTFRIRGAIDPQRFESAFNAMLATSDALRARIKVDQGMPFQVMAPKMRVHVEYVDLSDKAGKEAALQLWIRARHSKPIRIESALFDTALIQLTPDEWVWYLNLHHIVSDIWSTGIIYRRVESAYQELASGSEPLSGTWPTFASHVLSEKGFRESDAFTPIADFWRNEYEKIADIPALYGKRGLQTSARTVRHRVKLGPKLSGMIRGFASNPRIQALTPHLTYYSIFLSILFSWLHRITGRTRLSIGSPVHNRPTEELKGTIGLLIETLPLSIELKDIDTFANLVRLVQQEAITFFRHARPGASSAAANRGINVVLNYLHATFPGDFAGMEMETEWIHTGFGDAAHHLRLQIQDFQESGGFTLFFDFNEDLFDENARKRAIGHFMNLADAFAGDPDFEIDEPPLLTEEEERVIASAGQSALPDAKCIDVVDRFSESVRAAPRAAAISFEGKTLSYGELDRASSTLAQILRNRLTEPEERIAFLAVRRPESIVALLAALKAGAAYVPIDPTWPATRVQHILDETGVSLLLGAEGDENHGAELLCVDASDLLDSTVQVDFLELPGSTAAAYFLYTSGSTGTPKGVEISRGALSSYVGWAASYYAGDQPISFPLFTPLAVDLTVTSVFLPLVTGGCVSVHADSDNPAELVQGVLMDPVIDAVKMTPSHFSLVRVGMDTHSSIQTLILGGEAFSSSAAKRMLDAFGQSTRIFNEYGPTEATVGCMIHRFDPQFDTSEFVPIGRAGGWASIQVLDARGHPVPQGVTGEIFIGGPGLATGYLNSPDLTKERFVPDPQRADVRLYRTGDLARWESRAGDAVPVLVYAGRTDDQVKVRGTRVELGEIEAALVGHAGITDVVARVVSTESMDITPETFCSRCGLESTYPGVTFDTANVCSICSSFERYEYKARNWFRSMNELQLEFDRTLARAPSDREYDCLVLLSGGKDSTYALARLVDMGLRVLSFTLDNGYISEGAKANIRRVTEALGVDHVFGETEAMNAIFRDSLARFSNVCQGCFKTIYTLALNLADDRNIPIIVTGLSRGQFFETRLTEEIFEGANADNLDTSERIDLVVLEARKAYHTVPDAVFEHLDVDRLQSDSIFERIRFVDFYRFCDVELDEMMAYLDRRLPWIRPSDTGRSTNCLINEAGIFVHKRERGFHNYAFPYSWDVRVGHKNRDEALEELDDHIDERRVRQILLEIGYESDLLDVSGSEHRLAAYYLSDTSISATELRQFLAGVLPAQMIPTHFVRMDAFPLNATGKVDRSLLPDPGSMDVRPRDTVTPPRNEREQILVELWKEILRVSDVGIYDNFFDLGGESILAIQISVRAARHDLAIPPGAIFRHQTIAELAVEAQKTRALEAEQGEIAGPVELTPIQSWFFDHSATSYDHWNQIVSLDVSQPLDRSLLQAALNALYRHHDMLRSRFSRADGQWKQEVAAALEDVPLDWVHLAAMPPREQAAAIHRTESVLNDGLNISAGPLFRAVCFDHGQDHSMRLTLIAHRLCVDAVSWSVLLEDLAAAYEALENGDDIRLPAKTTSFKEWAGALMDAARADTAQAELPYWNEIVSVPPLSLPLTRAAASATQTQDNRSWRASLDPASTCPLATIAPGLFGSHTNEILLALLATAVRDVALAPSVRLDVEGHDREPIKEGLDTRRTVGWFTTIYPIEIHLEHRAWIRTLMSVQRAQRSIPGRGLGFGLLNHGPSQFGRSRVGVVEHEPSSVLFNYLGRLDYEVGGDSERFITTDGPHLSVDSAIESNYDVEIAAFIKDDVLQIEVLPRPGHVLARITVDVLERFVELCRNLGRLTAEGATSSLIPDRWFRDLMSGETVIPATVDLAGVEEIVELAPMQRTMLHQTLAQPDSGIYVEQLRLHLSGSLYTDSFKKAFDHVIAAHSSLRTAMLLEHVGGPLQGVFRSVELPWEVVDLSSTPEAECSELMDSYLYEDRKRGFDLSAPPLMRVRLFQRRNDRFEMIWSFHHAILDGWSTVKLIGEILDAYTAIVNDIVPQVYDSPPYSKFIDWLVHQDRGASRMFWTSYLHDFKSPISLRDALPSATEAGVLQRVNHTLPTDLAEQVRLYARKNRLTLNTLFQAAWSVLIARYTGTSDIVYGTTVAGRPASLESSDDMVGLFINSVPVRHNVHGSEPLLPWLNGIQLGLQESQEHAHVSLTDIHQWSAVPPGLPLFDNLLVFENHATEMPQGVGLGAQAIQIDSFDFIEQSDLGVVCLVAPTDEIQLHLIYRSDATGIETSNRLFGHLESLLQQITCDTPRLVRDLELLTAAARDALLASATDNWPLPDPPTSVISTIENVASKRAESTALTGGDTRMAYTTLVELAAQIAASLRERGISTGDRVGLLAHRTLEVVPAVLGIMKSGAVYVPINPVFPDERRRQILQDCNAAAFLYDSGSVSIEDTAAVKDLSPGTFAIQELTESRSHERPSLDPIDLDNTAYILYTSGSTGEPKGVQVSHRQLSYSTWARSEYYSEDPDAFLLLSPLGFDSSIAGLFWTLSTGGNLVLMEDHMERDIDAISATVRQNSVTHTLCVPTLYDLLLGFASLEHLGSLKTVIVAGEACSPALPAKHFDQLPKCRLYNEYGPTEATVWSSVFEVTHHSTSSDRIPIGQSIPGTSLFVLDGEQRLVPPGLPGELYIGGPGIADGYFGQTELTAERFATLSHLGRSDERFYRTGDRVQQRSDGNLEFLGRMDDQVKIRGHRIELGEVETALASVSGVRDAAVIAREFNGRTVLEAFFEYDADSSPEHDPARAEPVDAVRDAVSSTLPPYMIPHRYTVMDYLPRTPSGKVDRKNLPEIDESIDFESPSVTTDTESVEVGSSLATRLARLWAEALGVKAVGMKENFFDLGGDSILAIQIRGRAARQGIEIPTHFLFSYQTVGELASALESGTGYGLGEVTLFEGEPVLTPAMHWFFSLEYDNPNHWNQYIVLEAARHLDRGTLQSAFEQLVDHHDALRMRFDPSNGAWDYRISRAEEPRPFEWHDVSSLSTEETHDHVERVALYLNEQLDLVKGPLMRAAFFNAGEARNGRLLIVVHHLAVDAVSWTILTEDLAQAYSQIENNKPFRLPSSTTSFSQWSLALRARADAPDISAEITYWKEVLSTRPFIVMGEGSRKLRRGLTGHSTRLVTTLEKEQTELLLGSVASVLGARAYEVLLSILASAFRAVTGRERVRIDLEKHGREPLGYGEDVTRTVGWFTMMVPFVLNLQMEDPGVLVRDVRSRLSAIPKGGLGYGLLKYMRSESLLDEWPEAEVIVNYLGNLDASTKDNYGVFSPRRELHFSAVGRSDRQHALNINLAVHDQCLQVEWYFEEGDDELASRINELRTAFGLEVERFCNEVSPSADVSPRHGKFGGLSAAQLGQIERLLNQDGQ